MFTVRRVQAFDEWTLDAAHKARVPEGLRYAAQRLAQLLDSRTAYSASSVMLVGPLVAVRETRQALSSHRASRNPTRALASQQVCHTMRRLRADPRLASWYHETYEPAMTFLEQLATHELTHGPLLRDMKRGAFLSAVFTDLAERADGPLSDLQTALGADGSTGHLGRLTNELLQTASALQLTSDGWGALDRDLRWISTDLLAVGRDGQRTAQAFARVIRNTRDYEDVQERLRLELLRQPEPFNVAFVITGLREARRTADFECIPLSIPSSWPGLPARHDPDLTAFVRQHSDGSRVVFATQVQAHDVVGAKLAARGRAQVLIDQLTAQARVRYFGTADSYLIRQVNAARQHTRVVQPEGPYADAASPRFRRPDERFARSLRYGASGRHEASPVIAVLQHWIALESLTDGSGAPFMAEVIPPLMGLASIRQGLTIAWAIFRRGSGRLDVPGQLAVRSLSEWVGVKYEGRARDLNKWVDLLACDVSERSSGPLGMDAPIDQARQVLNGLLPAFSPFVSRTLERWMQRLASAINLADWATEMHDQAETTILRMRLLRNGAVHRGVADSFGSHQLNQAAAAVVDTVHEIVPLWTAARPENPTSQALKQLADRYRSVIAEWASTTAPPRIDVERLALPVGDGIHRCAASAWMRGSRCRCG